MSRHPQRGSGRSIDVPPNRMADTGRIYLFRKNMVRPGWGNHALKRGRRHTSPPRTTILERFSEQLNAHSEQLNATMCRQGTDLVAFTLTSHRLPIFHPLAEVRLLKPGIQRRWLAKNAPLPFRFASRFFNRFPVALPLRCFHLEKVSSRPPLSSNIFGRDPLSNVSYWNCGRPKLSKSP